MSKTMRFREKLLLSGLFFLMFLFLIVLVRTVDVAAVGPVGTSIGLSGLNSAFHEWTGFQLFWYRLSKYLGLLAILTALLMAVFGAWQLVKRKSLRKVDGEIVALAGLYALVVVLYVFFEFVVVNYRPVLMDGSTTPEPSFPSTHTMIAIVVLGSLMMLLPRYVQDLKIRRILLIVCLCLLVLIVVGRLLSGVHWLTDILGGILISLALLSLFSAALDLVKRK
ncbi:MAG: phosphatase PAP2 family protein [Lachnospiraceae bacterium]|nr:phosphatase PAP2 family protein [Lachnospiraceae bacterium]